MSSYQEQAQAEMYDAIAQQEHERTASERIRAARTAADWPEHYSARNVQTLVLSGAVEVAGYREWQQLGRQVRKGEHGIALLAPVTIRDAETGEVRIVNTKTTTVFDRSQTDPKD